jgi:hypothetical protein
MAVQQKRSTITTTPTLIVGGIANPLICRIHNTTNGAVYLGGPGVTTSNGYHLEATESFELTLIHGNSLYGVTASGSKDITVMWQEM